MQKVIFIYDVLISTSFFPQTHTVFAGFSVFAGKINICGIFD